MSRGIQSILYHVFHRKKDWHVFFEYSKQHINNNFQVLNRSFYNNHPKALTPFPDSLDLAIDNGLYWLEQASCFAVPEILSRANNWHTAAQVSIHSPSKKAYCCRTMSNPLSKCSLLSIDGVFRPCRNTFRIETCSIFGSFAKHEICTILVDWIAMFASLQPACAFFGFHFMFISHLGLNWRQVFDCDKCGCMSSLEVFNRSRIIFSGVALSRKMVLATNKTGFIYCHQQKTAPLESTSCVTLLAVPTCRAGIHATICYLLWWTAPSQCCLSVYIASLLTVAHYLDCFPYLPIRGFSATRKACWK